MRIESWKGQRGDSPVTEFILTQDEKTQRRIYNVLRHFEQLGLSLGPPKVKKLKGYDLHELRIPVQRLAIRIILWCSGDVAWLLTAFKKKSEETPADQIKVAVSRKKKLEMRKE